MSTVSIIRTGAIFCATLFPVFAVTAVQEDCGDHTSVVFQNRCKGQITPCIHHIAIESMCIALTRLIGAVVDASFAIRIGNVWGRRIFLAAVWALGLKALVLDIFGKNSGSGTLSHAAE